MYFDQALDAQAQAAFLWKVKVDPDCQACFQREQEIREQLRKRIYRPGDPDQLIQAIRDQIQKG